MLLPVILYLALNILDSTTTFETNNIKNELLELSDLFFENLNADPSLLDDHEVSDKSKRFIDERMGKFVYLLTQNKNAVFSRKKRNLKSTGNDTSRYSIDISPVGNIPSDYADDIRIFEYNSTWCAASLADRNSLIVSQYTNGTFHEIAKKNIKYNTNLAAFSSEDLHLIATGENKAIKVFQFKTSKDFSIVQTLRAENPQHVVLWEQDHTAYLAITDNLSGESDATDNISKIKIYKWLGKHFDLIQEKDLFNIKKTVPFSIHGSYFLTAVKHKPHKDESKSYSEIFKFDFDSAKFVLYQRLLTEKCTDVKYFTSELHGGRFHFLVVVHSVETGSDVSITDSKSVIYKYEDHYFLPFQSIQTDAVEWQPIQDSEGHAALMAVTKQGLQGYQYDGWHFFESNIISGDQRSLKLEDITTLHTYSFENYQILVLACGHCKNFTNVFKVNFTDFNKMKEMHTDILTWCMDSTKILSDSDDELELVAESLRGDLDEKISIEEDNNRQLLAALSSSNDVLVNLENLAENSLKSNNDHIFPENLEVDHAIFKDEVKCNSIETNLLNGFTVNHLLDNVFDISKGLTIDDTLEFDVVVLEGDLALKLINGVSLEQYINLQDNIDLDELIINGSVIFKNGVHVQKMLNNFIVNQENILLKEGDQEFSGNLTIDNIIVNNLTTKFLNTQNLELSRQLDQRSQQISRVDTLKVDNLDIGGFLNGLSIPALGKKALKKSGDQILEKSYIFGSLKVQVLNIEEKLCEKKIPEDFVIINGGDFTVSQDVTFVKGLKTNKLEVLHSLNNISITNEGELDILLTDSLNVQSIPVKKSFDNLILTNPIKLRYKIKNEQMDLVNPVVIDSKPYNVSGDVIIEGHGEVYRWLKVKDLKGKDGERSFQDVINRGLKLTDVQIPVHFNFTQTLDLDDIIADRVNYLDPHDWLLETSDSPQIINGQKTVLGDLRLEGSMHTFRLNDIDVHKLQKDVLRTEGDQEIGGVFVVDDLVANGGITSNRTYFGESPWNDGFSVNRTQNQLEYVVINGDLRVNTTNVRGLSVMGRLNSYNISEILRDLVKVDADFKVFGQKTFEDLHVDDLIIEAAEENDLVKLIDNVLNNEVTLNKNIEVLNNISVENIKFSDKFNGIDKENWKKMVNFKTVNDDVTEILLDRDYDELIVFGEVFISDGLINGRKMSSIANDSVKADEDYEFDHVTFAESIYVQDSLKLEGNLENLDLNNIVEQDSRNAQEVQNKTFVNTLFIDGTLNMESTLNGLDLKPICEFSEPSKDLKQIRIEGNVTFVKGPKVLSINKHNVKDLNERIWFVDKEAFISGTVHLQDTTFRNNVEVEEYVDEINLQILSQNYFSKSKNQEVPATFSFDNVTFVNISTPILVTNGLINGISLNDLLKTVLIQNVSQVFESPAYFEEIRVKNLTDDTNYLVNDLNLETDVMHYDTLNIVTGHKTIRNLNLDTLKLKKNINLQDVDVLEWLSNAMLTNGTYYVPGRKVFKSATFKQGLSLRGKLNDLEFDEETILLVDTPQNITGQKNFVSKGDEQTKFKILRNKGLVNDMHLESFVQNQPDKTQHNVLNSEIIFNNSIVVKNINVDIMYDDVNVTELLANITSLGAWDHIQRKYNSLLDMSLAIENSVKDQASFFKYFKDIMYLENVYEVFGLRCKDETFRLLTFSFENGTNVFRTFEWNIYLKEFVQTGHNIESYSLPSFMEHISIGDEDYIYIEHPRNGYQEHTYDVSHFGQLLQLINSTTFEPKAQFERNATESLISFMLPGSNQLCMGFIDVVLSGIQILCDESGNHNYYWFQTIPLEKVYKATTVQTSDKVYLFLAKHGISFSEPSIVVLESSAGSPEFKEIQTIFEGAVLNGIAATLIDNIAYVAFSFEPRESTINLGRISIRKLDTVSQQFNHWQHVPLTAPLGAQFVTENFFEPLLVVPSADASSPLQTLRYDGSAGFMQISRGVSLPPISRIRVMQNGKFVTCLQDDRGTAVILGAVTKGPITIN